MRTEPNRPHRPEQTDPASSRHGSTRRTIAGRWNTHLYLTAATFLICALAFINRYPFVYSDSGTYIRCAFTLLPPSDRPIGYSLIIRAVTWQSTLWTVVLFQGAMIAWLLYEVLRKVLPPNIVLWRVHLLLVAVLMLCTSMPWYAAQLMPDVITPLIVMVLFLLFRAPELGIYKRGFLWICLFFFLISHNAHVAMAALFVLVMVVLKMVRRSRMAWPRMWPNLAGVIAVLVGGVAFVSWYNGHHGLRPVFSPTANVFLTGRLCENRLLGDFLNKHCEDRAYPICPYKDDLPNIPGDFIWGEQSILSRMGGDMVAVDTLLAPMVGDLLRDPEFLGRYLRSCVVSTITQLFQVNTNTGLVSYHTDSAPYQIIQEKLRWEQTSYITSYQAYNDWDLTTTDRIVHIALFLALLVLAWTFPQWAARGELLYFVSFALGWVFLNAAVTSSLANVYDRLQSRVAWLVVVAACLTLLNSTWGQRLLSKPIFRRS